MTARDADDSSSPDRNLAASRARHSASGIGVVVVEFAARRGGPGGEWTCLASDGTEFRYLRVLADWLGPSRRLPPADVEEAVEAFAAQLPQPNRLYHLNNTNPIHLDPDGTAHD